MRSAAAIAQRPVGVMPGTAGTGVGVGDGVTLGVGVGIGVAVDVGAGVGVVGGGQITPSSV